MRIFIDTKLKGVNKMKYYYTDPLKAAWMWQEYSFKFMRKNPFVASEAQKEALMMIGREWTQYVDCENNFDGFFVADSHCGDDIEAAEDEYYIHPDCHEMLKPQIGDLMNINDDFRYLSTDHKGEKCIYEAYDYTDLKDVTEINTYPIIQRNGKAFFMPEVEND